MDWQTKEYLDERIDEINDKMDMIMENLNIDTQYNTQELEDDTDPLFEDVPIDDGQEESKPEVKL